MNEIYDKILKAIIYYEQNDIPIYEREELEDIEIENYLFCIEIKLNGYSYETLKTFRKNNDIVELQVENNPFFKINFYPADILLIKRKIKLKLLENEK